MMTRGSRAAWCGILAGVLLGLRPGVTAKADVGQTPIPEYTGDRIYVSDVPDTYQALVKSIKELERISPQSYFLVVVRSTGPGEDAVRYVDELYAVWSEQARNKGLKLDPDRSVITLLSIDDRKAAVRAGSLLREQFGLDKATVERLIARVFAPLARDQRYSEGAAALLASMNNVVAAKDTKTAQVETGTELFPAIPAGVLAAAQPPTATSKAASTGTPPAATTRTEASTARDLAWALLASLLAVGLIAAGLIWLARRRKRNSVDGKIKEYKKKAVDVMDQLDALKARLKTLPTEDPDFKEPMSGETLAMYEQAQTQLTGLWDRWLEVMDVLDKAQSLCKKDTALGMEKLKEADKLVSDSHVFEQIEEQAKTVAASMDRLNQAHETARTTADKVVEQQKEIGVQIGKVDKEGLPTVPYRPEIDGIAAEADHAKEVLTPDPIGAYHTLDKARERAVKLRDRVVQILDRYAEGRKITADLTTLGDRVAEYRRQGLRLDEEGGNPDHPAAQTWQRLESLRQAVHVGDPETALRQLNEAQTMLQQARQTLESVLEARELCAKDEPDRRRETRRLREAMSQYEAFESELSRDFAPSSWLPVSGHLAQARTLLATFDRKVDEAAAAATPQAQKYLLGSRLMHQVEQEQQVVLQLMSGLADRLTVLKAIREECQQGVRGLDDQEHAVERFVAQHDQAIGSVARATLKSAQGSRRQLEKLIHEQPPDWPRIRQLLSRTLEEYAIARNQAQADVEVYETLSSEYERTRREATRVQAFLAGHSEDRVAANQHYQDAANALSRVQSESGGSGGEWARILEMVRGAAADLARAEQLAREDIRLARQAESEIAEAGRTVRKARAYFSMGVTLGTLNADATVNEAQRLYQSQNYEQAIRTAAGAIQQIRQAYAMAAQQVFMRQMQIEANRRRYPAPVGRGMSFGNVSTNPTAPRRAESASRHAEQQTSASGGSWSSGSAEGSW